MPCLSVLHCQCSQKDILFASGLHWAAASSDGLLPSIMNSLKTSVRQPYSFLLWQIFIMLKAAKSYGILQAVQAWKHQKSLMSGKSSIGFKSASCCCKYKKALIARKMWLILFRNTLKWILGKLKMLKMQIQVRMRLLFGSVQGFNQTKLTDCYRVTATRTLWAACIFACIKCQEIPNWLDTPAFSIDLDEHIPWLLLPVSFLFDTYQEQNDRTILCLFVEKWQLLKLEWASGGLRNFRKGSEASPNYSRFG